MHANVGAHGWVGVFGHGSCHCVRLPDPSGSLAFPGTNFSYTYSVTHGLIHFIYFKEHNSVTSPQNQISES